MNPNATEAFLKMLLDIIKNITIISSNSNMGDLIGHRVILIEKGIYLVDDNNKSFEKLFDQIWDKLRCGEKFSAETVEKDLKQLVGRIVKEGNTANADVYFKKFIEYFETYTVKQILYMPLDNIEMQGLDKLEIGRIALIKMTDIQIDAISRKIKKTIMQTSHEPQHKPLILNNFINQEVEPLRGKICAEFRLVAEPEIVEERAIEEILRVIDLFRFAIPCIYSSQYPAYWCPPQDRKMHQLRLKKEGYKNHTRFGIGLQGEIGGGLRHTIIVSSKGEEFNIKGSFIGLRPFILSPDNINIMKRIGVFKVASLLKKSKLTSLEDVILRSIHWYANAFIQVELENQLLSLVTSLETILAGDGNLMDAVGYGLAFLLGTNINQRLDIIERYKDIYDKRSKTSHHGNRDADELDLIELRYLTFETIQKAIKYLNKWKEQKELLEWVRRQKLA